MAQNHAGDNIGYRSETANRQFSPLKILGPTNLLSGHNRPIETVDGDADDFKIYASNCCLYLGRQIGCGKVNASGDYCLIHKRPTSDVDGLGTDSMLLEDLVIHHNLEK